MLVINQSNLNLIHQQWNYSAINMQQSISELDLIDIFFNVIRSNIDSKRRNNYDSSKTYLGFNPLKKSKFDIILEIERITHRNKNYTVIKNIYFCPDFDSSNLKECFSNIFYHLIKFSKNSASTTTNIILFRNINQINFFKFIHDLPHTYKDKIEPYIYDINFSYKNWFSFSVKE